MKPLIIVCTDFSPCSDVAVARAADIAARDDVRVFLLHTYDPKRVKGPAAYAPTERDRHGWDEESMRQLKGVRHEFFAGLPDTDVVLGRHGAPRQGQAEQCSRGTQETGIRHRFDSAHLVGTRGA